MAEKTFGIRLKADASGFSGQVGEARREVEKFGDSADDASVAVAGKLGVAIGAAAVTIGGLFVNEVRKAIQQMDELDETATALGVAVDTLSSMQMSAKAAGVETNQFTAALTRLNSQIADAAGGNQRSIALFNALGISVRDSGGAIKSADVVLGEIANKFRGYADGAAKSNLATDLFSRGAAKMVTFLNEGSEGLTKFAGASKESVAEAARLAGEVDKLSASWSKLWLSIAGTTAGLINGILNPQGTLDAQLERTEKQIEDTVAALERARPGSRIAENLTKSLDVAIEKARELRKQISDAQDRSALPSAPVVDTTKERQARGRTGLTDAQREEIRLQRELEQILKQVNAEAAREDERRARQLAQMEEQNQVIRNQIEEFGKTERAVAELRAARLEDAAATLEQQAATLALTANNEPAIAQLREQVRLLRDRAQLTRAAGGQAELGRMEREGTEAARNALRNYEEEQRRVAEEWRRDLTTATQRGLEAGKGFIPAFAESLANTVQSRLSAAIADALVQLALAELAGGSGSSGAFDFIGDAFISAFGMHSGGRVGDGGSFTRQVPASVFAGARRYHGGGMVLGPNEVPIIAERGERVLTAEQQIGGGVTVNVHNYSGANVRTEQRASGDGMTLDVIVEAVEDRLAGNVATGRGTLASAIGGRFGLQMQPRG